MLFEEAKKIVEEIGEPLEIKGKIKISSKELGALLILIKTLNKSFAEGEIIAQRLGFSISKSSLYNYFEKVQKIWLYLGVLLLKERIKEKISEGYLL